MTTRTNYIQHMMTPAADDVDFRGIRGATEKKVLGPGGPMSSTLVVAAVVKVEMSIRGMGMAANFSESSTQAPAEELGNRGKARGGMPVQAPLPRWEGGQPGLHWQPRRVTDLPTARYGVPRTQVHSHIHSGRDLLSNSGSSGLLSTRTAGGPRRCMDRQQGKRLAGWKGAMVLWYKQLRWNRQGWEPPTASTWYIPPPRRGPLPCQRLNRLSLRPTFPLSPF